MEEVKHDQDERSLNDILKEVGELIEERRHSRNVMGWVRKPISHEGGGDYLAEEVIARLP